MSHGMTESGMTTAMSHTEGVAKVTISLPRDLLARADAARGSEPRSTWIARTLAVALSGGDQEATALVVAPSRVEAAPRRAPAKPSAAKRAARAREVVKGEGAPLPAIARRHWA